MAMRLITALFSAALVLAACGKSAPSEAEQPKQEEKVEAEAQADAPKADAPEGALATVTANLKDTTKVQIIEFSDFECPFCARVVPTLKQIEKEYGDKVDIVFLHQPLPMHRNARSAAIAVEAARKQGKFWEMHDKLFDNARGLNTAAYEKFAGEIGLDMEKFKADSADPEIGKLVDKNQAIANAVGATGTPAFFINGKNLRGAQPFEAFKKVIDEEIEAAGDNAGSAYIQERLKANNAALFNYVYEGKEIAAAAPAQAPTPQVDPTVYKVAVDEANDAITGAEEALITAVVFSEFQCPFCKRVDPTLKQLLEDYEGKLRIVFKHNPLSFHKDAYPASSGALCAKDQGKFWEMHDKLFENQTDLSGASIEKYAESIGLDMNAWKACVSSDKYKKQIEADQDLAGAVTARGTPNIFINGRKLTGAKPLAEFKSLIDEELKKAEAAVSGGVALKDLYAHLIKDGKVFEPLEAKVNNFDIANSPTLGKKDAKVQIVEFSDFQCPFCSRAAEPLEALQKKYGDTLSVTFKHFPLSFHKEAMPAAVASMCAHEQGKFWGMHDEIFANQKALMPDDLKKYAENAKLDIAKFDKCIADNPYQAVIDADMKEARDAGVRGTPTFFINGRKFNSNTGYTVEAFSAVIDKYILN